MAQGPARPGPRQIGYQWAYIFTAVCPATGEDFTLVLPTVNLPTVNLPTVNAKVMDLFLARFAATRPDDPHRRARPYPIPLRLSLDHKGQFIDSLV